MTQDAAQWDPYDEEYADAENRFLDFRGDLVHRQPKRRNILDDSDIFELQVSEEQYKTAISSMLGTNDTYVFKLNDDVDPHSVVNDSFDFIKDDDYMQAVVSDPTGYFDEEPHQISVTARGSKSKISMEYGNISLDGFKNNEDDNIYELAAAHAETPKGVTAEHLSKVLRIPEEVAQHKLDVTRQLNKQDADTSLSCRFGTNNRSLWYKRISSLFYNDIFFSKQVISKREFSMMQLFVSNKGFVKVYGMKSEKEYINALKRLCKEVGAPKAFIVDSARTKKSNKVRQFLNKVGTTFCVLEGQTQYADRSELYIVLMKSCVGKDMRESKSPMQLWCFACERIASVMTHTTNNLFQL